MRYATHYKTAWDVASVVIAAALAAMFLLWATQVAGQTATREMVITPWEGVFSAREYPGDSPFVEVGDHVEPETVIGIVYSNYLDPGGKLEITAGLKGTVVEVLVGNGAFVQAGQSLMVVELDPIDAR
jgi:biotin carboxyl carrier protein